MTHELTNRTNAKELTKNSELVAAGSISPKEYAKRTLNIEAKGVANKIKVAKELGIRVGSKFEDDLLAKLKSGKISIADVVSVIQSQISTAVDATTGKNAAEMYE